MSLTTVLQLYMIFPVPYHWDMLCCQDYDAMVSLVEDVESVPNNKVTVTPATKQWYAFALNRRNQPGDRIKALEVIQKVPNDYLSKH